MERHRFDTGEQVFDWTVPREWDIREAWIKDPDGETVVYARRLEPARRELQRAGPTPSWTSRSCRSTSGACPTSPTRSRTARATTTSSWGFCLTERQRERLEPGRVRGVHRRRARRRAASSWARSRSRAAPTDEVLLSTYLCHPSMANNELSGPDGGGAPGRSAAGARAGRRASPTGCCSCRRRSARSATWRASATGCASAWPRATSSPASATRAASPTSSRVAATRSPTAPPSTCCARRASHYRVIDFFPPRSDERQYCSPGFDLPVGSLMRSTVRRLPAVPHVAGRPLARDRRTRWAGACACTTGIVEALEAAETLEVTVAVRRAAAELSRPLPDHRRPA